MEKCVCLLCWLLLFILTTSEQVDPLQFTLPSLPHDKRAIKHYCILISLSVCCRGYEDEVANMQ
jgi:hypothetical protein